MLSLISYKNLTNWSVRFLLNADTMKTNYPQCSLGNLLQRNQNTTVVEDNTMYKRVTIKLYGKGVYLRDELLGKDIGTKRQYILSQGQFILSKIDARNGAFGIVPEELDGAITTADFVSFNINAEKIIPDFLRLLVSTEHFAKMCQGQSSGTTGRQRVSLNDLLQIKIPLPVIEKQREIVEKYNEEVLCSNNLKNKIINWETEIEKLWVNLLELTFYESQAEHKKTNFLNFVCLSQLSRWDRFNNRGMVNSAKYKFAKLQDVVIGKPLYGAGEKGIKIKSDTRYIRITDINEDGTLNDDFVSAQKVDEKYILRENDFLIARSGNTVGKTFLYKLEHGKCIYAGYLIKFRLNLEKVIPEYLLYYTKSKAYKAWIASNQRANAQPNINSEEFLNSPIVIPELSEQKNIVDQIGKIKQEIQHLKDKDKNIIHVAHQQFEKELFG